MEWICFDRLTGQFNSCLVLEYNQNYYAFTVSLISIWWLNTFKTIFVYF